MEKGNRNRKANVLGSFVEEMVFRFHIQEWMKNRLKGHIKLSIGMVVVLFALYHCSTKDLLNLNYHEILAVSPLTFLGIGAGYLQEKTDNILYPYFFHLGINMILFLARK